MTEFHFAGVGTLINVAGIVVGASVTLDPVSALQLSDSRNSFAAFVRNEKFSGD